MVVQREPFDGAIEAVVVYVETRGSVRLVVGPGAGQLDNGVHHTLNADEIPPDLRYPNARFWIRF